MSNNGEVNAITAAMIQTVEIDDKKKVAVNESTWMPKNPPRREWTTEGDQAVPLRTI